MGRIKVTYSQRLKAEKPIVCTCKYLNNAVKETSSLVACLRKSVILGKRSGRKDYESVWTKYAEKYPMLNQCVDNEQEMPWRIK
jgi:hypothetical protein